MEHPIKVGKDNVETGWTLLKEKKRTSHPILFYSCQILQSGDNLKCYRALHSQGRNYSGT